MQRLPVLRMARCRELRAQLRAGPKAAPILSSQRRSATRSHNNTGADLRFTYLVDAPGNISLRITNEIGDDVGIEKIAH
jgi:hypothetical protein